MSVISLKKGFTFIEIILVIGIIGILSAFILYRGEPARAKGRDGRRVSDIGQIQIGLEAYFAAQPYLKPSDSAYAGKTYPDALTKLVDGGYVAANLLKDPQGRNYSYQAVAGGKSYCLGTKFENSNNPLIAQSASCTTNQADDNYKVAR